MAQIDDPSRRGAPFHPGLVSAGATLLIAAFVTDLLYWKTLLVQWNNFSGWLLAAGLVLAALAAIAFVIDLLLGRVARVSWPRFAALAAAAGLAIVDALVHTRDAYTAVVPEGIALSALITVILLGVGLSGGWSLAARRSLSTLGTVRP